MIPLRQVYEQVYLGKPRASGDDPNAEIQGIKVAT